MLTIVKICEQKDKSDYHQLSKLATSPEINFPGWVGGWGGGIGIKAKLRPAGAGAWPELGNNKVMIWKIYLILAKIYPLYQFRLLAKINFWESRVKSKTNLYFFFIQTILVWNFNLSESVKFDD